jgi:hypothetical protein
MKINGTINGKLRITVDTDDLIEKLAELNINISDFADIEGVFDIEVPVTGDYFPATRLDPEELEVEGPDEGSIEAALDRLKLPIMASVSLENIVNIVS